MRTGKRILMFSMLVLACLLTASPFAAAQPADTGAPSDEKGFMGKEKMEKELGLSVEQREKMKALREEFSGKQRDLGDQVKAKRDALRAELDGEDPDRVKVTALVGDVSDLQKQMMINRMDNVFKVREILTPEQFKKLREARAKRMEERKEGRGDKKREGRKHWGDKE